MPSKKRVLFVCLVLTVLLSCPVVTLGEEPTVQPEKQIREHKIIRIHYIAGVDPQVATIKPGTTVIWLNDSRSLAEIYFTDKQVTTACKSPSHFVINVDGAYASNKIPDGGVASLCFIQKGEYDFFVLRDPRTTSDTFTRPDLLKGKIIVE